MSVEVGPRSPHWPRAGGSNSATGSFASMATWPMKWGRDGPGHAGRTAGAHRVPCDQHLPSGGGNLEDGPSSLRPVPGAARSPLGPASLAEVRNPGACFRAGSKAVQRGSNVHLGKGSRRIPAATIGQRRSATGYGLPFILGREKVRFSLLTCPPLPSLAVVNAQWAAHCLLPSPEHRSRSSMDSSKAHSLKVSPPSLSQRLRFYETAKLLR